MKKISYILKFQQYHLKEIINKILKLLNYRIVNLSHYQKLCKTEVNSDHFTFIKLMGKENIIKNFEYITESKSEFKQDMFVLNELNFKNNGYFVEFGSADGILSSNTYLLEKKFNWKGILVEPCKIWHRELFKNRGCIIDNSIVWKDSISKLTFQETNPPGLSTIKNFSNSDLIYCEALNTYDVATISLDDLLIKYNAPKIIDYLSIDTEGSEFDILNNFNFNNYQFRVITCEHNFTKNRELIYKLLINNGYIRKYTEISKVDDWYINPKII
jgi:FkbM family methyltransferase